jgi:hypothetical protein
MTPAPPRPPGWEARLADVVARYQAGDFVWGAADCAHFAGDAAAAVAGEDRLADLRGLYDGPRSAARALLKLHCRDLGDVFALRFQEMPPAHARAGDIGVLRAGPVVSGCVILGAQAAGAGERGLVRFPRSLLLRAFQV